MKSEISASRYKNMSYRRCGKSGLLLPPIALGLWQNFGADDDYEIDRKMILHAFNAGVSYIDIANNYGPPPGSAEERFGKILKNDLLPYRDELIISTKAGYDMWQGPYGDWGSKKYLIASLDQSLKRLGLDYVDIFYHHRFDPQTPLEETMEALDQIRRQGKALYLGISNYGPEQSRQGAEVLQSMGSRCIVNQVSYSMLNRWIEQEGLLDALEQKGMGCTVFSPLEQGILTDKYLKGIPEDSRAAKKNEYVELSEEMISGQVIEKVRQLNEMAKNRGQTMAQMALAWTLRDGRVTTAIVGARNVSQLQENLRTLENLHFSDEELNRIEKILQ